MNSVLLKLKKAIEQAIEPESPTREISLAEFPGHVIKSLEVILADPDEERTLQRLARLKAQVDEASVVAKQTAGAAEDLESVCVKVVAFEEPGLTAKHELRIAGAKRDAAEAREEPLQKAVDAVQHEVAELTRALGAWNRSDKEKPADGSDAGGTDVDKGSRAGEASTTTKESATIVSWPLDMNTTTSGAQPVTKADAELDWGPDPDLGPRAA